MDLVWCTNLYLVTFFNIIFNIIFKIIILKLSTMIFVDLCPGSVILVQLKVRFGVCLSTLNVVTIIFI